MSRSKSAKASSIRWRYSLRALGLIAFGFAIVFAWFSWRLAQQRGRWIALRKLDQSGATFSAVSTMLPGDDECFESCFSGEELFFPTTDPFGSGSSSKISSSFDRADSVDDWLFARVCELLDEPAPVDVRSIDLWQSDLPDGWTEREIGLLNRLGGVASMSLQAASLSCEDLKTIFGLPGLQQLTLAVNDIADSEEAFARADSLQGLRISDATLTKATFAGLAKIDRLQRLDLHRTRFASDVESLEPLGRLPEFCELTLTSIRHDDLAKLPQLDHLRRLTLKLQVNAPENEKLAVLERFPELESLTLSNVGRLSDADLNRLASVPKLRALSIHESSIDASGMHAISIHVKPRYLSLRGTGIDTDVAEAIGRMTSLEHLILADNPIDDVGFRCLDGLVGLRILDIDRRQVSTQAWVDFFRKHPQCREE